MYTKETKKLTTSKKLLMAGCTLIAIIAIIIANSGTLKTQEPVVHRLHTPHHRTVITTLGNSKQSVSDTREIIPHAPAFAYHNEAEFQDKMDKIYTEKEAHFAHGALTHKIWLDSNNPSDTLLYEKKDGKWQLQSL